MALTRVTGLAVALATTTLLGGWAVRVQSQPGPAASSTSLEAQFRDPPNAARPRVWWHWMNGNITKDGIAKDMAWMKRIGIGGLQNFDANLQTPQIVDQRLVYMTPGWKDAFRFTAQEADRHGLELAIAASPGWSETGGPWVPPEDGLKKLVWSETLIAGGKPFAGRLAAPPQATGPFGSLGMAPGLEEMMSGEHPKAPPQHYGDVRVLAFPVANAASLTPRSATDGTGKALDVLRLADADLGSGAEISRGGAGRNPMLLLDYGKPVSARSISLYAPGAAMMFVGALYSPRLEASDNGTDWRKVVDLETAQVPVSYAFPAVSARYFRIEFLNKQGVGMQMGEPPPGLEMGGDIFGGMARLLGGKPMTIGDLRLSGEARIDRYETKAGFAISQNYFSLVGPVDGATGIAPGSVVDVSDKMKPDGSLDWAPPRLPNGGQWRVLRFGYSLLGTTNHPAPAEATGLEVDKFDGAAVRRYIEHYIGMYRDASGGMIGARGVQAILTDSIEVGAANWTPKMIAQFKRLRGYDPTPWMPTLTGILVGSREDSDRFLYDYRRTLADLMASEHYGTVAAVAHEHGLKVYGEALEDHRPSLGDDMSMRRFADVPMAAMWTHSREAGPRLSYIADIKGAASVAHIYGQNLVAAESLTSAMSPWIFAPNNLKRIIDLEFVTGVNRPVIHTSVHQPRDDKFPGLSLFIFGQYFNRHETWAEMAKPWVDYLARNALMLQQGRNVADVGYFYGEEAPLTGLYGDAGVADAPKANAYDFVSADALMGALSNSGNELAATGGARYRVLYLGGSSHRMTLATLKRIADLVEGGATVVGQAPTGNPGLAGDEGAYRALVAKLWPGGASAQVGKGRVIASSDIDAALASIGIAPDFSYNGGGQGAKIPFLHRQFEGGDSYFLVNTRDRAENIEARFRIAGKAPELWHAETGTSEPVSYRIEGGMTIIPLTLLADESVHVVFRNNTTASSLAIKKVVPVAIGQLDGAWNVAFQPGRGAPASTAMTQLAPLNENVDAGIKYFSGIASYTRDFTTPKGWKPGQPLWVDLGKVSELAEVRVNGQVAGTAWHAPYRVDIGAVTRVGRNSIEVRVANLWVNRLIGDAQPGAVKITYTAMPTYRKDAPLRPSGLIGPVQIMGQGRN